MWLTRSWQVFFVSNHGSLVRSPINQECSFLLLLCKKVIPTFSHGNKHFAGRKNLRVITSESIIILQQILACTQKNPQSLVFCCSAWYSQISCISWKEFIFEELRGLNCIWFSFSADHQKLQKEFSLYSKQHRNYLMHRQLFRNRE